MAVGGADVGDVALRPEQAQRRAAEMPQVPERVKTQQIRAEHALDEFAPPRMAAEHLVRGKRRVQEKSHAQIRPGGLEHRGQQEQLVIVDPHEVAPLRDFQHLVGETLVDLAVCLPPARLVAQVVGHVVEQRPHAGIGKSLVVRVGFLLGQKNGQAALFVRELGLDPGLLRRIDHAARPADPLGLIFLGGKPFERGDQAAGGFTDFVVVPDGDGQTVGNVDQGLGHGGEIPTYCPSL